MNWHNEIIKREQDELASTFTNDKTMKRYTVIKNNGQSRVYYGADNLREILGWLRGKDANDFTYLIECSVDNVQIHDKDFLKSFRPPKNDFNPKNLLSF